MDMKKYIMVFVAAALACSCNKEEVNPWYTSSTVYARSAEIGEIAMHWQSGDKVVVFSNRAEAGTVLTLASAAGIEAEFHGAKVPEGKKYWVGYPSTGVKNGDVFKWTLPAEYPYSPVALKNMPMTGPFTSFVLTAKMSALCALIDVKAVGRESFSKMTLTADKPIAGVCEGTLADGFIGVTDGGSLSVSQTDCPAASHYWFVIPAGEYTLNLSVVKANGRISVSEPVKVKLNAGEYAVMEAPAPGNSMDTGHEGFDQIPVVLK